MMLVSKVLPLLVMLLTVVLGPIASGRCCSRHLHDDLQEIASALRTLSERVEQLKATCSEAVGDGQPPPVCRDFSGSRVAKCKEINGFRWTLIQSRAGPAENFNRSWEEYRAGFGVDDFWIGNEFLHLATKSDNVALRVELEDWNGNWAWAEYEFSVSSEEHKYRLLVDKYRGNATDGLSSHNGSSFSTFDAKNDEAPECCPCAMAFGGGWWFNSCFEANLNGIYCENPIGNGYYHGLIWEPWLGNYSLRRSAMMIRKLPYPRGAFVPEDP